METTSLISESPAINDDVACLDAASDGARLAVGTTNRTIQLIDISKVSEPVVRWTTPAQALSIGCVAFSPGGKIIATATRDPLNWRASGEVKLWDSETGAEIANLGTHSGEVLGACFDVAGQRLATFGSFYDVRLWDIATKKELPRLPIRANVVGAAFTSDGKRMILAQSKGSVVIWSIQRQMPTQEFDGHSTTVVALVTSHNRQIVVTRDVSNQAKVWKVPDE
jgi:WD40 repeat protein